MLANNVYFCGEERAAPEPGEVLQSRIIGEESTEFLPGGVRLDVGEIKGGKLGASKSSDGVIVVLFHDAKIRKSSEICKKKRKYFGIILNNVE